MTRRTVVEWLRRTGVAAFRGWIAFLKVWVPATLLLAAGTIWSGEGTGIRLHELWWIVPLVATATYSGAFAHAAAHRLEAMRGGYYARWAIAGVVGLLVGAVLAIGGTAGLAPFRHAGLWLGIVGGGAFTGAAYGWTARRSALADEGGPAA